MAYWIRLFATVAMGSAVGWLAAAPVWAVSEIADEARGAVTAIAQTTDTQGYNVLHVNARSGSDSQGTGSQMQPLKTITRALQIAQPNTLILLSAGTYDADSGERFPLQLQPGVTVQGAAGPNTAEVTIRGNGAYLSPTSGPQNVAIVGVTNAGLANVTISNPHPNGTGVWIENGSPIILESILYRNGAHGILIADRGTPVIRNNYFLENGDTGLMIAGPSSAQVQGNVFENTGVGIRVAPEARPQIQDNRITRNRDGLVLHADARPTLADNQIVQNRRNSIVDFASWTTLEPSPPTVTQPPPPLPAPPSATAETLSPVSEEPVAAALPAPPAAVVEEPSPNPERSPAPSSTVPSEAAEEATLSEPVMAATPAPEPLIPLGEPLSAEVARSTPPLVEVELAIAEPPTPSTAALADVDLMPITRVEAWEFSLSESAVDEAIAATPPPTEELEDLEAAPTASDEPAVATTATETEDAAGASTGDRVTNRVREANPDAVEISVIPPPAVTLRSSGGDRPARESAPPELIETVPPAPEAAANADPLPHLPPLVTEPTSEAAARLVVPSLDVPSGPTGEPPELFSAGTGTPTAEGPPPPPSLATTLGLRYRVLVAAVDPSEQEAVRAIAPDAFSVRMEGKTYLQVGAYATQAEAAAMVARLAQADIPAQIEEVP